MIAEIRKQYDKRYKKRTAGRRLKYGCYECGEPIIKGDVYYRWRSFEVCDGIYAGNIDFCARCMWENAHHMRRFEKWKQTCGHPDWARRMQYITQLGESHLLMPDHEICILCGKKI